MTVYTVGWVDLRLFENFDMLAVLIDSLKWQCHEIFWHFFYETNLPAWPMVNRPKWFC